MGKPNAFGGYYFWALGALGVNVSWLGAKCQIFMKDWILELPSSKGTLI
jgi:hypothetical protein